MEHDLPTVLAIVPHPMAAASNWSIPHGGKLRSKIIKVVRYAALAGARCLQQSETLFHLDLQSSAGEGFAGVEMPAEPEMHELHA